MLAGGNSETVTINDGGKDFYSPGSRTAKDYAAGHEIDFGVPPSVSNWGG